LCALGFQGKGYSEPFVENFGAIVAALGKGDAEGNESVELEVTPVADSICAPCPHRRGDGCESGEKIALLDAAHADALGLSAGEKLTWKEAKVRIRERISVERHHQICAPCAWRAFGICESALRALRDGPALLIAVALSAVTAMAAGADPADSPPAEALAGWLKQTRRTQVPKALIAGHDLAKDGKPVEAIAQVKKVLTHERFGDIAIAITAGAERSRAETLLNKKSFGDAAALALRARDLWLTLVGQFPYSAHLKKLPEELARCELVAADAHAGAGKSKLAIALYEKAFQRLSQAGALSFASPSSLGAYAAACKKSKLSLCDAWISRWFQVEAKGSEEQRALLAHFPELATRPRSPYSGSKLTQAYRAPDLDQVAIDAALALYFEDRPKPAMRAFEQFLDEFPRSQHRLRARFWLAQLANAERDEARGKNLLGQIHRDAPLSYYGLLSSMALGFAFDSAIDATLPELSRTDPYLTPAEGFHLERAESLIALGAMDLASQELREIKPRDGLSPKFLIYLASLGNLAEAHSVGFGALTELIGRGAETAYTSYGLRHVFPLTGFWEEVKRQAEEQQVDPILVLSLMKQESAFESGVQSSVGATGLMQLMPQTAVETEPSVVRAQLLVPEVNIRVGIKYLKKMLKRYNGNIALALASYNAGPGAVDRWIRENRAKRGLIEFIEQIPYRETRDYVGSIIRNHYWYSRRILGEGARPIAYFWNVYGPPAGR